VGSERSEGGEGLCADSDGSVAVFVLCSLEVMFPIFSILPSYAGTRECGERRGVASEGGAVVVEGYSSVMCILLTDRSHVECSCYTKPSSVPCRASPFLLNYIFRTSHCLFEWF
jgi:hypothetical protein